MPKPIDIIGMRFGRLVVVSQAENRRKNGGKSVRRVNCTCDCGNTTVVDVGSLTSGNTRSCGCLFEEGCRKTKNHKTIEFVFHDDYVEGIMRSGKRFLIDVEDYEKVKDYCWHIGTREGYIMARIRGSKQQFILLHRLIMNPKPGEKVDHINHDPFDNRKCNLRIVTHQQNMMNTSPSKSNKSGCPGVWYRKKGRSIKRWIAYINVDKKMKHLGDYATYDEAVAVRKGAEKKYYGEYAYDYSIASVPSVKNVESGNAPIDITVAIDTIDPVPEFDVLPPLPEFTAPEEETLVPVP